MTDDARLEKLTKLVREVYRSRESYGRLSVVRDTGGGVDVITESGGVLIAIGDHLHALEALEVALLVMLARTKLDHPKEGR